MFPWVKSGHICVYVCVYLCRRTLYRVYGWRVSRYGVSSRIVLRVWVYVWAACTSVRVNVFVRCRWTATTETRSPSLKKRPSSQGPVSPSPPESQEPRKVVGSSSSRRKPDRPHRPRGSPPTRRRYGQGGGTPVGTPLQKRGPDGPGTDLREEQKQRAGAVFHYEGCPRRKATKVTAAALGFDGRGTLQ